MGVWCANMRMKRIGILLLVLMIGFTVYVGFNIKSFEKARYRLVQKIQMEYNTDKNRELYGHIALGAGAVIIIFAAGSLVVKVIRKKDTFVPATLDGELLYGKSKLNNVISLSGRDPVVITVGPGPQSEYHVHTNRGTTFSFTITPVRSMDGNTFVTLQCDPPGMFHHRGVVKTEANLFGEDRFLMNGMAFKYRTRTQTQHGDVIF